MDHDLFTYPKRPGFKERTTSREAARFMGSTADNLRAKVLAAIQSAPGGLTADQTAEKIAQTILAIRPRVSELREQKKIVDSGTRRKNQSGRSAIVWKSA